MTPKTKYSITKSRFPRSIQFTQRSNLKWNFYSIIDEVINLCQHTQSQCQTSGCLIRYANGRNGPMTRFHSASSFRTHINNRNWGEIDY